MRVIKNGDEGRFAIKSTAHAALTQGIRIRGEAVLALSGGSTPKHYLPDVFSLELNWQRVTLILADERWVPPTDPLSNEKLIEDLRRDTPAEAATLFSLWSCGGSPQEAARNSQKMAQGQNMRIDLALLGMGEDGHIASLFPGDTSLTSTKPYWIPVDAPSPPNVPLARLSLTPTALLESHNLVLVFSGGAKFRVWTRAWKSDGSPSRFPANLLKAHKSLQTICIM